MTTDNPGFMQVTLDNVGRLLAIAASVDGRTWPDDDGFRAAALSWYETIRRDLAERRRFTLTYRLAEDAVYAWYGGDRRRIMPADLLDTATEIRQGRLQRTPVPEPSDDLDVDDPAAWPAAHDAAVQAIIEGRDPAAAIAAVAARYPRRPRPVGGGR